jgi:murein DD-endopeptidase MepM/ murein hydrolase activator NlpD
MADWLLPFPDKNLADKFGEWPESRKKMGLGPHRGVDWNGIKKGTALPAVHNGTISQNYWSDVLGWVVELRVLAPFGKERKMTLLYFMYCHLDKQSPMKVGTKVKCGDSVGALGNSGSASSGPHLHFALSTTTKGGAIGKVYDAHAYLTRQIAESKKTKAPAKVAKPETKPKCCAACTCTEGH